tara:strand:- start:444 stop:1109 length:666 start_codon:yes stop_codon:yes gene_type:complete
LKKIIYDKIVNGSNPKIAFIAIHGWSGNKDSFKSIVPLFKMSDCTWYFPEGPYSVEGDHTRKSWASRNKDGGWDVNLTSTLLQDLLDNIILKQFKPENIFVIGFSQGAAVCYEFMLSLEYPFGGIFPVAGFLRGNIPSKGYAKKEVFNINVHPKQINTPILIGHGQDDDIVPIKSSKIAYKALKDANCNVDMYIYNGKHKIGIEYIKKVKSIVEVSLSESA